MPPSKLLGTLTLLCAALACALFAPPAQAVLTDPLSSSNPGFWMLLACGLALIALITATGIRVLKKPTRNNTAIAAVLSGILLISLSRLLIEYYISAPPLRLAASLTSAALITGALYYLVSQIPDATPAPDAPR